MKDALQLDYLCITASSLNYVLNPPSYDSNSIARRMYKSALNTIRRIEGFPSEDNYIFRQGHIREDEIVQELFQDSTRFDLQKKCSAMMKINDETVKFTATLDVFHKEKDFIIEIKNIINHNIPENVNLDDWTHNVYCKQYNAQVQIQMFCCKHFKHLIFLVNSPTFEKYKFSKKWIKDESFIDDNRYMILDYWEVLHKTYESFKNIEYQVVLDLIENDEDKYKVLLDSVMTEEVRIAVDDYLSIYKENIDLINKKREIDKQKRELDKILDPKKSKILSAMIDSGLPLNEFYKMDDYLKIKIKHTPENKTFDFERIVRDSGLLHSMSEEDKEKYTIGTDESFSVRVYEKKKDFYH